MTNRGVSGYVLILAAAAALVGLIVVDRMNGSDSSPAAAVESAAPTATSSPAAAPGQKDPAAQTPAPAAKGRRTEKLLM